jgi:hypothetical protein
MLRRSHIEKHTHAHQADASLFLQQSSHGRQEPSKATMFLKDKYDKHVTKFDFDKIEYDKVIKMVKFYTENWSPNLSNFRLSFTEIGRFQAKN